MTSCQKNTKFSPTIRLVSDCLRNESRRLFRETTEIRRKISLGTATPEQFQNAIERLTVAKLALNQEPMEFIQVLNESFETAKSMEALLQQMFDAGEVDSTFLAQAKFCRQTYELYAGDIKRTIRLRNERTKSMPQLSFDDKHIQNYLAKMNEDLVDDDTYKIKDTDGELTKLKKQQINAAIAIFESHRLEFRLGTGETDASKVFEAQIRVLEFQFAFHNDPVKRRQLLESSLEVARDLERAIASMISTGQASSTDGYQAAIHRIEIEKRILQFRDEQR